MNKETTYEFASECVVGTETLTIEEMKQRIDTMKKDSDFLAYQALLHEAELRGVNLTRKAIRLEIKRLTNLIEASTQDALTVAASYSQITAESGNKRKESRPN